jgi:hypothetical protein
MLARQLKMQVQCWIDRNQTIKKSRHCEQAVMPAKAGIQRITHQINALILCVAGCQPSLA